MGNITMSEYIEMQHALQVNSFGKDPLLLEGEERIEFIRWNFIALVDELGEMMDEVGWKPWATSRHVNEGQAVGELVDAWHFFMNLLMAVSPRNESVLEVGARLERGYLKKRLKNAERQRDGYDGVRGKCRACKRDLEEAGVGEYREEDGTVSGRWCRGCGAAIVSEDPAAKGPT